MMLLIDYIDVLTKGAWHQKIKDSRFKQYFTGAFLGALPGCLGSFTTVSLYSHNIISLGAVVTAMIATSGDEAFVMFSLFPIKALWITAILIVVGLIAGILTDKIWKRSYQINDYHELPLHEEEEKHIFVKSRVIDQLRHITFPRALLMIFLIIFLVLLIAESDGLKSWGWETITFSIGGLFSLFVVSTVPDHFLEEHLWEHVVKKHLFRIFMWTFGTMIFVHFLTNFIDVDSWIKNNLFMVLIIAILIGLIPESGPHLIFVNLYMTGTIPIIILIASSIVQDGHGMIPMLAVSKKSFVSVKLISALAGFIIGGIGLMVL